MRLALVDLFHAFLPATPAARAANSPGPQAVQLLQQGATLVVPQPAGARVSCLEGCLWITHDGDCKDVVLAAGESYASVRGERMLVHGLARSAVRLH